MGNRPAKPVVSYESAVLRLRGEEAQIRHLFSLLASGDGVVAQGPFFQHCLPLYAGFGDTISNRLFEVVSTGGERGLSYEEFLCAVFVAKHGTLQEKQRLVFNMFDLSGGGVLKKTDFKSMAAAVVRGKQPPRLGVALLDRSNGTTHSQRIDFDADFKPLVKLMVEAALVVYGTDGKMCFEQWCVYAESDPDVSAFIDALRPPAAASFDRVPG